LKKDDDDDDDGDDDGTDLGELGGMVWAGCTWLRIWTSSGVL
jgi:hypothetical protein